MNIEAPIIPGESAAGIQLGSSIEEVLKEQNHHFISEEVVNPFLPVQIITRYRSAMVDVWVRDGIVDQIMVYDGYRGKLMGKIGLGSTIADIERHIGAWEEDEEDNLVIRDLPGVGFEIEGYFPGLKDPVFRHAPIKEIYVFKANKDPLKQLKVVDNDLATYLKILPQDRMSFTYYTFDTMCEEYWNIFGIRYQSQTPLLADVRLMYIDQDARDWDGFVAERDAPGYVTFSPDDYSSVISFFEMLVNKEVLDQGESIKHFSLMSLKELVQFHYPQSIVNVAAGNYYRYLPDEGVQDNERISVLGLPGWSAQYGKNQVTSLWFITLSQRQLENPRFNLVDDADGLGTMTFNLPALEELIILLKRRIQSM